ncbi:MAG TPA: hypothetical protein VL122_11610 [Nitrospirota bacterium]|nr:hypothetical protein [Nitrospirota bacterium]
MERWNGEKGARRIRQTGRKCLNARRKDETRAAKKDHCLCFNSCLPHYESFMLRLVVFTLVIIFDFSMINTRGGISQSPDGACNLSLYGHENVFYGKGTVSGSTFSRMLDTGLLFVFSFPAI